MKTELESVVSRIRGYKRPNSAAAEALLRPLNDYDGVYDAISLLDDYKSIERDDYDDRDDYADDRSAAWDAFLDSLDDISD